LDSADFGASRSVFESDGDGSAFANVVDERRSETSDAYSALVTDARVNDTGRPGHEQLRSQILGSFVANRVQAISEASVVPNIMKLAL